MENRTDKSNAASAILSSLALALSALALIGTGITLYQVSQLRDRLETVATSLSQVPLAAPPQAAAPSATASIGAAPPVPTDGKGASSLQTPATGAASVTASAIQPGQFVQPAFENVLQVELLKANRVPDNPNAVNVQMRIRMMDEAKAKQDTSGASISFSSTTARNPQTSETYQAVNGKSTNTTVSPFFMALQNQGSVDAYVWLDVPANVDTIDIYVPNTQAFTGVPISPN